MSFSEAFISSLCFKHGSCKALRPQSCHYETESQIREPFTSSYFLGGYGSGARQRLSEGRHGFDVSFKLPDRPELGTSFEGKSGFIRYYLKAELDEARNVSHLAIKPVTFISPVNINRPQYLVSSFLE